MNEEIAPWLYETVERILKKESDDLRRVDNSVGEVLHTSVHDHGMKII